MPISQETIDKIKKLDTSEKIGIIEEIWNSIAEEEDYPELTEEQHHELNRRIESYHANPNQGRTWDQIKKDLLKKNDH